MPTISSLVLLLFVGWGAGWFVARSQAGQVVREAIGWLPVVGGVVHCAACSGFWIGLVSGRADTGSWLGALVVGAAVMGVNATLDAFTGAHAARERRLWNLERELEESRRAALRAEEKPAATPAAGLSLVSVTREEQR